MYMKHLQSAWYIVLLFALLRMDSLPSLYYHCFIAIQSWHLNSKVDEAFRVVPKHHDNIRVRLGPEMASLVFPSVQENELILS